MNLIDTLKNELNGEAVNSLSQKLNVTSEQTQSGISVIIPAILAGILKKVSGAGSLGSLGRIFTGNPQSVETQPEAEFGDTKSLLNRGSIIVADLFGRKGDEISDEISKKTNLSTDKSESFLTMATTLIMGHIDGLISKQNWSMPDFVGKLFEEKASIEGQLPAGLISSFGLRDLNLPHINQTQFAKDFHDSLPPLERAAPPSTLVPESRSSGRVLKWVIIIIILALIAWLLLGRNKTGNEIVEYSGVYISYKSYINSFL